LIAKVRPEVLSIQKLPINDKEEACGISAMDINMFERYLVRNGTVVLKFFLNISKKEQRSVFLVVLNALTRSGSFLFLMFQNVPSGRITWKRTKTCLTILTEWHLVCNSCRQEMGYSRFDFGSHTSDKSLI
jgi:hypothetical protein